MYIYKKIYIAAFTSQDNDGKYQGRNTSSCQEPAHARAQTVFEVIGNVKPRMDARKGQAHIPGRGTVRRALSLQNLRVIQGSLLELYLCVVEVGKNMRWS